MIPNLDRAIRGSKTLVANCDAPRSPLFLGENEIERVKYARQPEEEAKDQVDDGLLAGVCLEINGQRRQQNGQDDQNDGRHSEAGIHPDSPEAQAGMRRST